MRADERIAAFLRAVADETRRILEDGQIDLLVVAGEEPHTTSLLAEFHQTVRDRVVGSIRMDMRATDSDLIEATQPTIDAAVRRREEAIVQALADGIGAGQHAAANISDTLAALQLGQVDTLVMVDDLHAAGWADYELALYGAGLVPSLHSTGGDAANLVGVVSRGGLAIGDGRQFASLCVHRLDAELRFIRDASGARRQRALQAHRAPVDPGSVGVESKGSGRQGRHKATGG